MKILDLVLKNEWFDMIKNGNKREEYREIKPYWIKRLCHTKGDCDFGGYCEISEICTNEGLKKIPFTHVKFRRGYTKEHIIFRIENIKIGIGKKEWGAPEKEVFIIKFAEKELKKEFDEIFGKVLKGKVKDYYINNEVHVDILLQLLTDELKKLFSDEDLKFKSDNELSDFTLLGDDTHTNEIMRKLLL